MAKDIKLDELAETIARDMDALVRGVAIESANRIVDNAPVDSGALKASIKASVNGETVEYSKETLDPTGQSTKASNESIISNSKAGDVVNIVAGAPYSQIVEEGSSKKAPTGFVKIVGESLSAIVAYVQGNLDRYR